MPQSRVQFARTSREIAYRAYRFIREPSVPVAPMPADWDGAEAAEAIGRPSALHQFALARLREAELGDPRAFADPFLDGCAKECSAAAALLDKLEARELCAALERLGQDAADVLNHPAAERIGGERAAATLRATYDLQRAVFEARKRLGRPQPYPREYGAVRTPFQSLLWRDANARNRGLAEQALDLHESVALGEPGHVSHLELGHIMDWLGDTNERTRDIVSKRLNYSRRATTS